MATPSIYQSPMLPVSLHDACFHDAYELVVEALEREGVDVNAPDKDGDLPIHLTARRDILLLLLNKGAVLGKVCCRMWPSIKHCYMLVCICSARQVSNAHSPLKLLPSEILKRICLQLPFRSLPPCNHDMHLPHKPVD